jgi:NAD(P)-dependent dehydrogenase (short-subunit alcohol dehydrogenase family)
MASVLITGTSKGIGFEAALAFGRAGHTVHATMRKPSQSSELAEIAAREKLPINVSPMDVDSDESCIINVTSVAGRIASAPMASYIASKWALEALSEALAGEMKTFCVRVVIVEPGIIDTAMALRIGVSATASPYRQRERFAALFTAALKNPAPPSLVAKKIVEIAESDTWQLRHPVGPDAGPFLQWRSGMTDEAWVDLNASDDETWYRGLERDFGLDSRPKN